LEFCGAAITPLAASRFESSSAEHRLKAHFKIETLDSFGDFRRIDVAALGALLDYITITQVGNIPYLRNPRRESAEAGLLIDASTRTNLELTRSQSGERKGSLLACMSETATAGGARMLSDIIATPLADHVAINHRLDVVTHFFNDERLSGDVHRALKVMPDLERALARLTSGRGGPRDLANVRDALSAVASLQRILTVQTNLALMPHRLVSLIDELRRAPQNIAVLFVKALSVDLPLLARDGGFIATGYREDLDENRKLRDDTKQVIAALQAHYAEISGVRSLKIKHNNVLGYFIEVTTQQADILKSSDHVSRFIHRQSIASAARFTTTELGELEHKIALAASRVLAVELELFKDFVEMVVAARAVLSNAAQALAEIDVHSSLASIARQRRYVRPRVDDSLAFTIVGGRHPIVEEALRNQNNHKFAANDCNLSPEKKRLWLLTGPNMAGKSTFLRQNALIAILAQAGCYVPASEAHIGCVDRLYSRVGAADDLARGRSTFMVEMIETAAILNQATSRSLVILDEIGRGTATYDGLSIAWATLEHLHDVNCARALFATHYHELTALTSTLNQLHCATMKVKEWKGDIIFLHEVGEGSATRSYGIQAAKLAGIPREVIARAGEVLKRLEAGRGAKQDLVSELPLFSARPVETKKDSLRVRLENLRPDDLSPREALTLIYELKNLAQNGEETLS
jgi:DNA mismatch repair protein MutS